MSITFLCLLIVQAAVITAVTLALTARLARRNRLLLGVILSFSIIVLLELFLQWTVTAGIRYCMREACASAGQPADCVIAQFGCSEWSGLSRFVYLAAGVVDLAVYLIGGGILLLFRRRKLEQPAPSEPVGGPQ